MRRPATFFCLLVSGFAAIATAEEPPVSDAELLRATYREEAEKREFMLVDGAKLKLADAPVMHWSNYGEWAGDVFVWTLDGRPAVIGGVLSWPSRGRQVYNFSQEFHLLAEQPIAPTNLEDGRRWAPEEGLKRKPIADAPTPAATARARLVQMRKLASSFKAFMEHDGNWELRLLPQPLVRYGNDRSDAVDGALFSYVWSKGTDPEVILLLECHRQDQTLSWRYAPVLFTTREVWLKYDDREVWHVDPYEEPPGAISTKLFTVQPHFRSIQVRPKPDAAVDATPK
ncbi:MAG: hypothetical protein ACREHD_20415 [Pirellulales bacterium]